MEKIKYVTLSKNFLDIKKELFSRIKIVGNKGSFILGKDVDRFENELKKFIKSKYVATCANGTDAIEISLQILNIQRNDEVIITSNTWLSVANAIANIGAVPRFVDIDKSLNVDLKKLEKSISNKTKCIIITHLNGLPVNFNKIIRITKKKGIKTIEDCSQAIGSKNFGIHVGNSANVATYSLHPTKNLGVFGDGGFIATNDKQIYQKFLIMRNNGLINRDKSKFIGQNSRLDSFQAIVGSLLLKTLNKRIKKRQQNANLYYKKLVKINQIKSFPQEYTQNKTHTYHRFVIQCESRNKLLKYLTDKGIEAKIHYPVNIHEQIPFRKLKNSHLKFTKSLNHKTLSLPINEHLSLKKINSICNKIKQFYNE